MLVYKIARRDSDEKSLPKCFNRLIFFILVPQTPRRRMGTEPTVSGPMREEVAEAAARRFITAP